MSTEFKLIEETQEIPLQDYLRYRIANYIALTLLQAGEGGVKKIALNLTEGILTILQETEKELQGSQVDESIPQ